MPDTSSQESSDLKWVHYTDVVPWADNPNIHPEFQPEAIAESIRAFGFVAPAVLWPVEGRLVAGHGRLQAMRLIMETGYDYLDETGDVVHVDADPSFVPPGAPGPGYMRILFHDFPSAAAANAYALADNELAKSARWDEGKVAELLRELHADPDFTALHAIGFDADRLQEIISEGEDQAAFLSNAGGDVPPAPPPAPTEEPPAPGSPAPRAETLVDFTVPMSVAERAALHGVLNAAKRNEGVTTTREAVVLIFKRYEEQATGKTTEKAP